MELARKQLSKNAPDSPSKDRDIALLTELNIDQDSYFAHSMYERFKIILHDLKDKHKEDTDTSDFDPKEQAALYKNIMKAMEKSGGGIEGLVAAIITSIGHSLKINENNPALVNMLSGLNIDKKAIEEMVANSELSEPNARKRKNNRKKLNKDGTE